MTNNSITFAPITPIPELPAWGRCLSGIASKPLEKCPRFPEIARRHEAWWRQELDRPLILAAGAKSDRPITRRLELLNQPEKWLAAKRADLDQIYFAGDALPSARVDFGPVMLGGLLGANVEFQSDTTWTHASINDDWSNLPDWNIKEDNDWWILFRKLTALLANDAQGRYLVMGPDFGGSSDVLLNLRGSSGLCLDAIERPDDIRQALDNLYGAWRKAFSEFYRITMDVGAGLIYWLGLWSDVPYMIPACDFNFMIGRSEFDSICLPDIARQTATVGRAVFHLDGPGASRHAQSLLQVPEIRAIQFTPGEGTPSALPWLDMFRMIQRAGRSVLVSCPLNEVTEISRSLDPSGLAFLTGGPPQAIDATIAQVNARF